MAEASPEGWSEGEASFTGFTWRMFVVPAFLSLALTGTCLVYDEIVPDGFDDLGASAFKETAEIPLAPPTAATPLSGGKQVSYKCMNGS